MKFKITQNPNMGYGRWHIKKEWIDEMSKVANIISWNSEEAYVEIDKDNLIFCFENFPYFSYSVQKEEKTLTLEEIEKLIEDKNWFYSYSLYEKLITHTCLIEVFGSNWTRDRSYAGYSYISKEDSLLKAYQKAVKEESLIPDNQK